MTKTQLVRLLAAACVVSLAGCAVPTTGAIPLSDGLMKVTRQGSGAWVATSDLKAQGIQEANASCIPKRARVIDVKETQARPFGGWPEAEVLYKCE